MFMCVRACPCWLMGLTGPSHGCPLPRAPPGAAQRLPDVALSPHAPAPLDSHRPLRKSTYNPPVSKQKINKRAAGMAGSRDRKKTCRWRGLAARRTDEFDEHCQGLPVQAGVEQLRDFEQRCGKDELVSGQGRHSQQQHDTGATRDQASASRGAKTWDGCRKAS